jgi:hypothetical protein
MSEREPVFLSKEESARRQRNKRVVVAVVGALAAFGLFALWRGGGFGLGGGTASSNGLPGVTTTTAKAPATGGLTLPTMAVGETASTSAPADSATTATAGAGGGGGDGDDAGAPADDRTVEELLKEARGNLNRGRYQDAIMTARAAVDKDPELADGYMVLYWAYDSIGKAAEKADIADECARRAKRAVNTELGGYKSYCLPKKK